MTQVNINSGVCGFETTVSVEATPDYQAKLTITSKCPHVNKLAEQIGSDPVNVMTEVFKKGESQILTLSQQALPHVTCPVSIGILKALEASAGLALPKDVTISFK